MQKRRSYGVGLRFAIDTRKCGSMTAGRKRPYTARGIRRLKCVRCGKQAHATWNACADGNIRRPLCLDCDVALNELVLRWMGFKDWRTKMRKYARGFEPPA